MFPTHTRELNMKKLFLILVAVICFGKFVNAQTESASKASNFLLLIENTNDGIKLTSKKGCAFKELSLTLKKGESREINQFGVRGEKAKVRLDDETNFASFRFKITKKNDGTGLEVALEGIEGTTWKELSFSIPKSGKLIDENGIR